jgi:outer membrane protein assembly factor BamA
LHEDIRHRLGAKPQPNTSAGFVFVVGCLVSTGLSAASVADNQVTSAPATRPNIAAVQESPDALTPAIAATLPLLTDKLPDRPRYVVETISIRGNDRTDISVIMPRVQVHPGELLDEERVELTRLRLLATGFFTEVNVRLERGSKRGHVVVVVELQERAPLPILEGVYLGFSETTPFFGGLSVVDPNFLGRGVELGAGFVLAPDQQSYRARLATGSLFGSAIGTRLALLLLRGREPIALGDDARAGGFVDYVRGGGYAGIRIAAGDFQSFVVDYHGELISADPRLNPRVRSTPNVQPGVSYLSAFQLAYQYDSRDRAFIPTNGTNVYVGAQLASALLGSAYEYGRYHLSYEQYIPTWASHSFLLRFDFGIIQAGVARGNTAGAPFFEAYYIGDYSFFRRSRNSLPRQLGLNLSAFSTYDDILGSVTVEYAYPLLLSNGPFYRIYAYLAVNVSEGTTLREIRGIDPASNQFPITFDGGLKFDSVAGSFVLSASYLVDLVF